MDLGDLGGNVREGAHIAAIGGTWMTLIYGFAGLREGGGRISFEPRLPQQWEGMRFQLTIRGQELVVDALQPAAPDLGHLGQELAHPVEGRLVVGEVETGKGPERREVLGRPAARATGAARSDRGLETADRAAAVAAIGLIVVVSAVTDWFDWYNMADMNIWAGYGLGGSPWLNDNAANYWVGEVVQSSNIFSQSTLAYPGTFIYYGDGLSWADYEINYRMKSVDNDGMGIMFRYTDSANYYRFHWHREGSFGRLVKNENASEAGATRMTVEQGATGTPAYMPPEMAYGNLDYIGKASDVYLLGATLFSAGAIISLELLWQPRLAELLGGSEGKSLP